MRRYCYYKHAGIKYEVWLHGKKTWTKSTLGYYRNTGPSEMYCLGNRMIHPSWNEKWLGSTSHDWHGYGFTTTQEALDWVLKADLPELESKLWEGCDE